MGKFITETIGRIAGNVTQNVITAILVFLITTYVIVDLKKGKPEKEGSAADTVLQQQRLTVPILPGESTTGKGNAGRTGKSGARPPGSGTEEKSAAGKDPVERTPVQSSSQESALQAPPSRATLDKGAPAKGSAASPIVSPVASQSQKAPDEGRSEEENPVLGGQPEGEKVKSIATKPDTAAEQKSIKSVKKRADDVFDELDKEAEKDLE